MMKKDFTIKGLTFTFRSIKENKDGYFEYIDLTNPIGVRRLPFSVVSNNSEFAFHKLHFVGEETPIVTDDYIDIVNAATTTNVLNDAVIVGLRFFYRNQKQLKASSLRLYKDRLHGTQYHFVADRSNFSKYITAEGEVILPVCREKPKEEVLTCETSN